MNTKKIESMITYELTLHPSARLQDIYKLYMQSVFGPGHLIADVESARAILQREVDYVKTIQPVTTPLIQPVDAFFPLARCSVRLIVDGHRSFDDYLNQFINSAMEYTYLDEHIAIDYWKKLTPWLYELNILEFESDLKSLNELFTKGKYLVSHTNHYRDLYKPTYRIMNISE
jgi:hypothetical protein